MDLGDPDEPECLERAHGPGPAGLALCGIGDVLDRNARDEIDPEPAPQVRLGDLRRPDLQPACIRSAAL